MACGRQKQSWPGQALLVLYCPMMNRPPRVLMTVHSASANTQRRPYQRARAISAPATTVMTPLYQVLNRLPRSQPSTPTLVGGGGRAPVIRLAVSGWAAIIYRAVGAPMRQL